jgi:DNA-binding response OmpR family regulator
LVLKVLIAEDEPLIASLTEDILVEYGYEVCGIASTVIEAVALAKTHKPDLAVIDLRLAGNGLGTEIIAQLGTVVKLGVLYTTGASQVILTSSNGHASLAKPFRDTELVRSLEIVGEILFSGLASPPFPSGFQLLPVAAIPGPPGQSA